MAEKSKLIETVPNFSEGRDLEKIEKIVNPFRNREGVKLLAYQRDEDHNRLVVTAVGEPGPLKDAVIEAAGVAIEEIDMRNHQGQHPRMGAMDVLPFIPIKDALISEAVDYSKEVAKEISEKYSLPIFLYEESATDPGRKNLAVIRKGQFEGMTDKIKSLEWKPDFGPASIHETAGVTAVGARMPLIAYNVNLDTSDLEIANRIAKNVRYISGGLRYCKAIGIELKKRNIVQVSMNLTDYTKTSLYRVFELVRIEAERYGVNIVGSEIIGIVPMEALIDSAAYYMGIEDFTMDQVLEYRLME
ncbi:glutamate formimidoyltransferase [Thermodesulfobacteriota bacterium]